MAAMAQPGDYVALTSDPTQDLRDAYSRLLAYIEEASVDYGRTQVKRGLAKAYVYEARFQRLDSYKAAQRKARRQRRGVWRGCSGDFHSASRR